MRVRGRLAANFREGSQRFTRQATSDKRKRIEITNNLMNGTARFVEQDPSQATYWRKRSRKDGLIDWRMHAETVHNLIRALAEPYPGAEFKYHQKYIKVWDSKIAEVDYPKNIYLRKPPDWRAVNIDAHTQACEHVPKDHLMRDESDDV